MSTHHDPEAVLAQDDWLRRIARSLVRDPGEADDLVQEAWVASLQRGERDRSWLFGVLRNVGASRARSDASQRARAVRAAEGNPSAGDPTDDVAADLEMRELLARELRGLPEPFRTAVHHRFVADLSLREIAQRTGVSRSTVSERVTRGLALLRQRMDRAYGGDRGAWAGLLLPLARPEGLAGLALAVLTMSTLAKGALAAAAAALAWLALDASSPSGSSSSNPAEIDTRVADASTVAEPAADVPDLVSVGDAATRRSATRPSNAPIASDDATPGAAASPRATVRARFRLPDGRPAAGAEWELRGWAGGDDAVRRFGLPDAWENLGGTLDASGDVDVVFDAPRAYTFAFTVTAPGCVRSRWQWPQLAPRQVKDLGEVTLLPACRVGGRLLGPDGEPLAEPGWTVTAKEVTDSVRMPAEARDSVWTSVDVHPVSARFVIDGMPPGPNELQVSSDRHGTFQGPTVYAVPGRTVEADVRIGEVLALETSVLVHPELDDERGAKSIDPERVRLVDANGKRLEAERHATRIGFLVFEDVGPGVHRLVVDDPNFEPATRERVVAGDEIRIPLVGSAGLRLDVRDGDGAAIGRFSVELTDLERIMAPRERLHDGEQPLADGLLAGLVPGSYRVIVRTGDLSASAEVRDLEPGETRVVALPVSAASTLRGRAVYVDGDPAPRVVARLLTPAQRDDGPDSFVISERTGGGNPELVRHEIDRAITGPDGGFALAVPGPGRYLILVGEDDEARMESDSFHVVAGEEPDEVEVVAVRPARVRGRIDVPPGLDLEDWEVLPHFPGRSSNFQDWFDEAVVNSEGGFELNGLQPGPLRLYLVQSGKRASRGGPEGEPTNCRLLAELVLRDGEDLERAFTFPGRLPSTITFELVGAPAGTVTVYVRDGTEGIYTPTFAKGPAPFLGPLVLDPGPYRVTVHGEGWAWRPSAPIEIAEGQTATLPLEVDLVEQDVLFVAEGAPVGERPFVLSCTEEAEFRVRFETDGQGRAHIRVRPGTYTASFYSRAEGEPALTAQIELPLAGPPGDAPRVAVAPPQDEDER